MQLAMMALIMHLHVCGCIMSAAKQTWTFGGDGSEKICRAETASGNILMDKWGRNVAFLGDDEVVESWLANSTKDRIVLKLDHKTTGGCGVIVQYYSRLLWIMGGRNRFLARTLLHYDGEFLMKNHMSVSRLVSVSDDGWSIRAILKLSANGHSEDVSRTINPFKPKFLEE